MTEKMILVAEASNEERGKINFFTLPNRYRWYLSDEIIVVDEDISVTYKRPESLSESDLREKAIDTLRKKQERIIAEAEQQKNKLQEKINDLLLITFQHQEFEDC